MRFYLLLYKSRNSSTNCTWVLRSAPRRNIRSSTQRLNDVHNLLEGPESGPSVYASLLATTWEFRVADFFLSSTRVELSKSVIKTGIGQSVTE